MNNIRADATVFVFFSSPSDSRGRLWVSATESQRSNRGDLILVPILNAEARNAMPWKFGLAQIAARRFGCEGFVPSKYQAHFALQRSDSAPEIYFAVAPVTQEDRRVPMHYKGLLAVPGRDVREGECWYVRFVGPGQGIESIRGSSPEEVIDRVYEMNLQHLAEHYEAPPVPESPAPQLKRKFNGRVRPGDLT